MTAISSDTFFYKGEKYSLVALNGKKLITPEDYGMNPQAWATCSMPEVYSTYEINTDSSHLKQMVIPQLSGRWIPIQGIMPTPPASKFKKFCNHIIRNLGIKRFATQSIFFLEHFRYENLNIITPFTGRIRLGRGFINDFYIHARYQKAIAYQTLLEFVFVDGKLISTQDLSEKNAQKRNALK